MIWKRLEKARKVEFSDQEIAEESEKVIDEAKKLFESRVRRRRGIPARRKKENEDTDTE